MQVKRWMKKYGTLKKNERIGGFLNFSSQYQSNATQLKQESNEKSKNASNGRSEITNEIEQAWRALSSQEQKQ